ncbi:hypothetical protein TanjilG_08726 [Lupinus angustifolius]|uniref:Homeobox-leucine zipper protein n=1 Tax=Lupinus angustifolius TaxID=3871 RepID=A0A4P1QX30_LUPAN|nr:hypothetical protein TanjilG_08726 [Lupinus angustifolius]
MHQNPRKKKKNKIENNKKRFSDEQIRSLECVFESESKLEPWKKLQVAKDLGLQHRQVAIWFQNRRARFESLKNEKESLQLELQKLSDLMETSHEVKVGKENSTEDDGSGSGYNSWRVEVKPSFSNEGLEDREAMHCSNDQNDKSKSEKSEERGQLQHQVLRMDEYEEIPNLALLEKWYNVDPSGILNQSCSSSQWLDFWT